MRKAAIVLVAGVLALGADNIQVSMPKEAVGFRGMLLGQIVKPVANGCFTIKVVKVLGYAANNNTRMSAAALTEAWKDTYDWCGPARGAAALPQLNVGDMVVLTCFQNEMHLRYSSVSKHEEGKADSPQSPKPPATPPPAAQPSSSSALVEKVKNAPANTWVEIPKSPLMSVAPKPGQFPKTWAVCGPSSVVMAWCGAAFDSKRDRLVVWGGGHADYHGNELYAFDVKKMAWERLTDPFPNPVKDREVNADGTPNSRHTYGGLAYIAHADRFFGLGGSLAGVGFAKCDRTWTFDFDTKKWEDRQPGGSLPGGGFCLGCAYDPDSKKVYFGSDRGLFAYDYDRNTWAKVDGQPAGGLGFAVDTKRKVLIGVGRGNVVLYDIGRNNFKPQNLTIPGGGENVHTGNAAGLDYDPVADRMVGWAAWAPGKIYLLDLDAKKWEVKEAEGSPKVTRFARNGVFGRWRYVASVNAFIAVSDAHGNVFFYKHTAGAK